MLTIVLILFFYLCLKAIEKVSNKYKKRSYILTSNTNVLITGACSGIGKQLALNFAKNLKCQILILDILPEIPKQLSNKNSPIFLHSLKKKKVERNIMLVTFKTLTNQFFFKKKLKYKFTHKK